MKPTVDMMMISAEGIMQNTSVRVKNDQEVDGEVAEGNTTGGGFSIWDDNFDDE